MLRIADIITPEAIVIGLEASSKKQALLSVARMLAHSVSLPEARVFKALVEREALGPTGFGNGVAVPHARMAGLDDTHAFFARLAVPVDFGASDDQPVDLVCAIIGPEGSTTEPFEALVSVCRALRNPEAAARLRKAESAFDLYVILAETG